MYSFIGFASPFVHMYIHLIVVTFLHQSLYQELLVITLAGGGGSGGRVEGSLYQDEQERVFDDDSGMVF